MRRGIARALAALLIVAGLGASVIVCDRVGTRGRFAVAYSTYGSGPAGARALFRLAERRFSGVTRWQEDLARPPEGALIVALGGCGLAMARDLSRFEREALGPWIERGGVLLVAGADDYLWPELGVTLSRDPSSCPEYTELEAFLDRRAEDAGPPPFDPADPFGGPLFDPLEALADDEHAPVLARPTGAPLEGLGVIPLHYAGSLHVKVDAESTTVLEDDAGKPLAVIVRRGRGAVVALASASAFQNEHVEASDGGPLFARLVSALAPDGPVLFDEYHLGVGERRSVTRWFREVGAGPIALQALVVVGLLLWRGAGRFGSPRVDPPPPPHGTASYVEAIGTLFARAGDPGATLALVARHALSRVAAHHHVEAQDPGALAKALEERKRTDEARAVRELGGMLDAQGVTKSALVGRVRRVDQLLALATKAVVARPAPAA